MYRPAGDSLSCHYWFSCGERFPGQIADEEIRALLKPIESHGQLMNPGLPGNICAFLNDAGFLIYGTLPGDTFDEARYFQTELKPLRHLLSAAGAEVRVAGGANLVEYRSSSKRLSAFVYATSAQHLLQPIIERWPNLEIDCDLDATEG